MFSWLAKTEVAMKLKTHQGWVPLTIVTGCLLLAAVPARADLTITVDFNNSSDTQKDSDGAKVTATLSGLAAADRTAILNKIKEEYKDISGIGTVTVKEGAVPATLGAGEYAIIVSGGKAPSGSEWGDAGVDGGPGFVYLGAVKAYKEPGTGATVAAQADINTVVGETAGHEAGHRIGKFDHNEQSAATSPNKAKMIAGSGITIAQRIADKRFFTDSEIKSIQENYNKNAAPKPPAPDKKDLNAFYGRPVPTPAGWALDDNSWGTRIWLTGAAGWEAGYIDSSGSFIYETANQSPGADSDPETTFMGFLFPGTQFASWDMALRDPVGDAFDFEAFGLGSPSLSHPNPLNPSVFLQAQLDFLIDGTPFSLFLDNAGGDPTTGGFTRSAPEPSTLSVLLISLACMSGLGRRFNRGIGYPPQLRRGRIVPPAAQPVSQIPFKSRLAVTA